MTFEQAAEGTLSFVAEDVLPSMPNGPRKFAAYMALGALRRETARNGGEFSCRDQLEETLSCVLGLKTVGRIREMRESPAAARR